MKEIIVNVVIYLILGMSFISMVWIFQGMKRLTPGFLRDLFKDLLIIVFFCLIYAALNFFLAVGIIRIAEPLGTIINNIFIVFYFILQVNQYSITPNRVQFA